MYDQTRYEEALSQFQQATNNDPNSADGYYNLAATYHRLGNLTQDPVNIRQAEDHYNLCLDKDGNHPDCYRGLAVFLVEQQRSEEAFRLLKRWAERSPTLAEPRIELARLSEEFSDREAAKEYLIEALSVDHKNPRALAALGRLREQMGEHQQALHNYRQSLMHDQFQPDVRARVASLQSTLAQPIATTINSPPGSTRIVTRDASPHRY